MTNEAIEIAITELEAVEREIGVPSRSLPLLRKMTAHEPPAVHDRPLSASQRLHNICDALSEQADQSPFTREEWEQVDKATVEQQNRIRSLEAEVSTLRDHLAEVNRLMSLNCREVERLRSTQPPGACQYCGSTTFICGHCTPKAGREHDIESFIAGVRWCRMASVGGNHLNEALIDEDAAYFADSGGNIRCRSAPTKCAEGSNGICVAPADECCGKSQSR